MSEPINAIETAVLPYPTFGETTDTIDWQRVVLQGLLGPSETADCQNRDF